MDSKHTYTNKLRGASVLIIGGSAGIGYGVADALLEHGASVIISSCSRKRVEAAEVENLFEAVKSFGKLDHVIFTAGDSLKVDKLENFSLADIQNTGTIRFFAPIVVAQHIKRRLHNSCASSFTLTTGGAPNHGMKDWAILQGYIGGISGLARGLAVDLAPIRVNAIGLGPVDTELWDDAKQAGAFDQLKGLFESKMTTGRIGEVNDVAETYLYVMKDRNVSGTTLYSNGGCILL